MRRLLLLNALAGVREALSYHPMQAKDAQRYANLRYRILTRLLGV